MKCESCGRTIRSYALRCSICGKVKFPVLAELPREWICALCSTLDPIKARKAKEAQRARGVRAHKARGEKSAKTPDSSSLEGAV
jgi:hypothetical protein